MSSTTLLVSLYYLFWNYFLCCRYLQEYTTLGTAGGMYHFRDQILSGNPELFFVMNCDVCGDFPLLEMLNFHKKQDGHDNKNCFVVLGTEVQ
mgnify:CR=1 FL=1